MDKKNNTPADEVREITIDDDSENVIDDDAVTIPNEDNDDVFIIANKEVEVAVVKNEAAKTVKNETEVAVVKNEAAKTVKNETEVAVVKNETEDAVIDKKKTKCGLKRSGLNIKNKCINGLRKTLNRDSVRKFMNKKGCKINVTLEFTTLEFVPKEFAAPKDGKDVKNTDITQFTEIENNVGEDKVLREKYVNMETIQFSENSSSSEGSYIVSDDSPTGSIWDKESDDGSLLIEFDENYIHEYSDDGDSDDDSNDDSDEDCGDDCIVVFEDSKRLNKVRFSDINNNEGDDSTVLSLRKNPHTQSEDVKEEEDDVTLQKSLHPHFATLDEDDGVTLRRSPLPRFTTDNGQYPLCRDDDYDDDATGVILRNNQYSQESTNRFRQDKRRVRQSSPHNKNDNKELSEIIKDIDNLRIILLGLRHKVIGIDRVNC